jgi:hypothetical protein
MVRPCPRSSVKLAVFLAVSDRIDGVSSSQGSRFDSLRERHREESEREWLDAAPSPRSPSAWRKA